MSTGEWLGNAFEQAWKPCKNAKSREPPHRSRYRAQGTLCLKYVLSLPGVHVAICGAGTEGQMADNIRTARNFKKMTPEEMADVRKRAIAGAGVFAGPTLEYWKKKAWMPMPLGPCDGI
jgi:predicted aldo/keto reductase-like oxidoreductase